MADKLPGRLAQHPTVQKVQSRKTQKPGVLDADGLREICMAAGADDVAFASVHNPDLASELEHVETALPGTKSYISLVVKMNSDNVRSTARSVANQEFHRKKETLYVLPNSKAKAHAERRYPHKRVKVVDSGVRGR